MRNGVFYLLSLAIMHFDKSNNYFQITPYLNLFKKQEFNIFLRIIIYSSLYLGILLTISRSAYFSLLVLLIIIFFHKLNFSKFSFFQKINFKNLIIVITSLAFIALIILYVLDYGLIENFYNFY